MNLTATHYIILAIAYFGVLVLLGILSVKRKEKIRSVEEENRAYRRGLLVMTAPILLLALIWVIGGVGVLFLYVLVELIPDPNPILLTILLILYAVLSIFFGIKAYISIYKSISHMYDNDKNKPN